MTVRTSIESLRDDLGLVRKDLASLTSELAALAQEGTQEAKERLFARIASLQSEASVLQERLRQALGDNMTRVDAQIHDKPYHTALVAGILGGVIAWMITRQRD